MAILNVRTFAFLGLGGLLVAGAAPSFAADPCHIDSGSILTRAVKEAARDSGGDNPLYEFNNYVARLADKHALFAESSKNVGTLNELLAKLEGTPKSQVNVRDVLAPLCDAYHNQHGFFLATSGGKPIPDDGKKGLARLLVKATREFNRDADIAIPRLRCEVERTQKGNGAPQCQTQEPAKAGS